MYFDTSLIFLAYRSQLKIPDLTIQKQVLNNVYFSHARVFTRISIARGNKNGHQRKTRDSGDYLIFSDFIYEFC